MSHHVLVRVCTELTAFWCPLCGDCTCSRTPEGRCCMDRADCPLHAVGSKHAETVGLETIRKQVSAMAVKQGISLTDNDHAAVSRFAQYLYERSKKNKEKKSDA